jgi:prolyl 4-hydroxylase
MRRAIRPSDWFAPPAKTVLSQAPRVVAIGRFLSAPACDWIIRRAMGRTGPALVYDPATGAARRGDGRNNTSFEFAFLDLDLVVLMVRARMAAAIGMPVQLFENPQVLHYDIGQAFAPHHDYLDPRRPWTASQIAADGQRIVTFLVYLNDGYDGAETDFPFIGLRHRGQRGSALYFGNVDTAGTPDPRTLHAGLAPTRGEKWLFSQWIRDRPRA